MRGDCQNYTRSPCRPVTHLYSHEREKKFQQYLERVLKGSSVNSFLTAKFDKCGKNKHDVFLRKVSNTQEKVRGMLKAEFMKWLFRFGIIKRRLQLRH